MKEKILQKYTQLISDIDSAIRNAGQRWPDTTVVTRVVTEAAYNDYKDGFANLDFFVRAEIFEDFLTMSEYLLDQGYYIPAASLAGGVLEDSLRKLSDKHDINYPEKTKINNLSTELAKAGIYNALVSKEIIVKADIRNNADHGKTTEFNEQDVKNMIEWIRRFIIDYLN